MAGICTSPYPSPYPIEKVGDSPYPYLYPVNAGIPRQNGDGFGQYPRGRVYLPSLVQSKVSTLRNAKEKRNTTFSKLEDCDHISTQYKLCF